MIVFDLEFSIKIKTCSRQNFVLNPFLTKAFAIINIENVLYTRFWHTKSLFCISFMGYSSWSTRWWLDIYEPRSEDRIQNLSTLPNQCLFRKQLPTILIFNDWFSILCICQFEPLFRPIKQKQQKYFSDLWDCQNLLLVHYKK